jgi:hypothetical protein
MEILPYLTVHTAQLRAIEQEDLFPEPAPTRIWDILSSELVRPNIVGAKKPSREVYI